MSKPDKEKLEEAKRVAELKGLGLSLSNIGDRMGLSESTVKRRLIMWERHLGEEKVEAESKEARDAQMILQTVLGIVRGGRDTAADIGKITGANVSVIEGVLNRIRLGKATKKEIFNILSNFGGAIYGYFQGKDVFRSLRLPDRAPIIDREELKQEVKKEVLAELGPSGSGKSEKSEKGPESHKKDKKKD